MTVSYILFDHFLWNKIKLKNLFGIQRHSNPTKCSIDFYALIMYALQNVQSLLNLNFSSIHKCSANIESQHDYEWIYFCL